MTALRALDRFWFAPASPTPLAVLRIVVGLAALASIAPRFSYLVEIAGSSPSVFTPVGLAAGLEAPIPQDTFQAVLVVALVANLAVVVGWRLPFTGPLFAALYLWILTYRNSWSMIYHTDNLVVLHVLILALTRSADALSLDARRRAPASTAVDGRFDRGARGSQPDARHWEYGYPIRLMCTVTVITYVLAGVAKVAGPMGLAWATGEGLRDQVAFDGLRKDLLESGAPLLAYVVYNNVPLAAALGFGSLALELGAPVALLGARLGWLWALGAFAMHWGIYAIMGISFWYPMFGLAFASFVVDDRLVGLVRRWRAGPETRFAAPILDGGRRPPPSPAPSG